MPYQDSPGWERQWKNFSWEWDFHVSTVSEGHRVVNDRDKNDAKTKGAKLTFGEVLDCGVLRMLHNLGAPHKASFHDLGMGPGKMLIQTYLRYENMTRCMGVELAKGRYDLGERNIRTLLKTGWRGRSFLGIEFKKGEFFKIVEDVPHKTPAEGWKVGDRVVAYFPLFKKDKMTVKDYHGVITAIKPHESGDAKKTSYGVQYDDGTTCDRVQHRHLFIPGTERTCEVWFGSLFDYPGGFDAEMCILETDFPEEMHPQLIGRMCSTPLGCTFLTYHDLKKFECYDWDQLRQIDCNIYDNDRYITSWSQGWRFFIWRHIAHFSKTKHFDAVAGDRWRESLKEGDQILFKGDDGTMRYGEIAAMATANEEEKGDAAELIVKTNRIEAQQMHYDNVTVSASTHSVFRTAHRFKIGDEVSAYYPDNLKTTQQHHIRFQIYRARVIGVNAHRLSYVLRYSDEHCQNITKLDVSEQYVYALPELLYEPGEQVMACWPRNAQNKNCPHRYKRFPADIVGVNNDATYRLRYHVSPYLVSLLRPQRFPEEYHPENSKKQAAYCPSPEHPFADTVREMWIQYPAHFVVSELEATEERVGTPFYMTYDPQTVAKWDSGRVAQWLCDIGVNEQTQGLFAKQKVKGPALLALDSKGHRECRASLRALLLPESERTNHGLDKATANDSKTESVEIVDAATDGLALSRVEMRNLFANIKHLKAQHHKMQQGPKGKGDLESLWKNFRKNISRGTAAAGRRSAAALEDTDTK